MPEISNILYRKMYYSDVEQAATVLTETFTTKEPMSVALGISYREFIDFAEIICAKAVQDGHSIVAIDQATGDVVGLMVMEDLMTEQQDILDVISDKFKPIFSLSTDLEKLYTNFTSIAARQIALSMLGVIKDYENRKISSDLILEAIKIAKEQSYTAVIAEASSLVTQFILERKFGFECKVAIEYKSYQFEGQCIFQDIKSPQHCKLMYKKL